jgi:uncharacterized protein (DUF2384 family)
MILVRALDDREVREVGLQTFPSEQELANWLATPSLALNSHTPAWEMQTPDGKKRVLNVLAAAAYGVYL